MLIPSRPAPAMPGCGPGYAGRATRKAAIRPGDDRSRLDLRIRRANIRTGKHPEERCASRQTRNWQEQERAEPWQQDDWFFFSQLWRRRLRWAVVSPTTRNAPSPAPRPGRWWPTRSAAAPSRVRSRAPRPARCATTSTSATELHSTRPAPGATAARAPRSAVHETSRPALRGGAIDVCALPVLPDRPSRPQEGQAKHPAPPDRSGGRAGGLPPERAGPSRDAAALPSLRPAHSAAPPFPFVLTSFPAARPRPAWRRARPTRCRLSQKSPAGRARMKG